MIRSAAKIVGGLARSSRLTSTRGPQRSGKKTRAKANQHATHSRTAESGRFRDEDGSPGQFGISATRDATAEEKSAMRVSYAPDTDGDPDPGEVVWTWVPFVEHDGRGKDRPVLVVGRIDSDAVAACYLSTKHHDGFINIGAGPWDSQGRESFLNPARVLRVTAAGMRREASIMPKDRFDRAVKLLT